MEQDHSAALTNKLKSLNMSQMSIETLSEWIMFNSDHAAESVAVLDQELYNAPAPRKINYIYLCNDIIQKSFKQRIKAFTDEFQNSLPIELPRAYATLNTKDRDRVDRLLKIWSERSVFPYNFIQTLKSSLVRHSAHVVPVASTPPGSPPRSPVAVKHIIPMSPKKALPKDELIQTLEQVLRAAPIDDDGPDGDSELVNQYDVVICAVEQGMVDNTSSSLIDLVSKLTTRVDAMTKLIADREKLVPLLQARLDAIPAENKKTLDSCAKWKEKLSALPEVSPEALDSSMVDENDSKNKRTLAYERFEEDEEDAAHPRKRFKTVHLQPLADEDADSEEEETAWKPLSNGGSTNNFAQAL